jgi:chromosome segregation ATPase
LLDEDIIPRVEKLKRDKADYLEYQRIEKELEELGRKLIAFDFFSTLVFFCKLRLETN